MRRSTITAVAVAALGVATLGAAGAQHGHGHGSRQQGGADGEAPHRRIHADQTEANRVIAQGLGFGMAFAADRNGYPGPIHVLELRDHLQLTPEQQTKILALRDAMFAASRPASARLLEAEAHLDHLFADTRADEPSVRAALAEIERARAEVRAVHLLTHLQTRDILTASQRRTYHELRWPHP